MIVFGCIEPEGMELEHDEWGSLVRYPVDCDSCHLHRDYWDA